MTVVKTGKSSEEVITGGIASEELGIGAKEEEDEPEVTGGGTITTTD